MVKLTDEFVVNMIKENPQRKTHLLASERNITAVCALEEFTKFKVMDLRYNQISDLKGIGNQSNLTHLYLQNNELENLNGFSALRSLEVLYLDFNKIEVVEMLDHNRLKKLSLKGQRLNIFQKLAFDPACLEKLKDHVEEIDVSANKLTSLGFLRYLSSLKILDISNNYLSKLDDLCKELSHFPHLRDLNLKGNPVMKNPDTSVMIISQIMKLEILNCNEVSPNRRIYCENIFKNKNPPNIKTQSEAILPFITAAKRSSADLPFNLRPKITQELLEEIRKKKIKQQLF